MKLDKIWNIKNINNLLCKLSMYVAEKCDYGDCMDALSAPERIFYITQTLEMEVNNGGFSQFFYNSGGDLSGELVAAFEEIGAKQTAALCQKALDAFGCKIPADREERCDLLDELDEDALDEIWESCDDAFYESEEDLNALNYAYILKHKTSFT